MRLADRFRVHINGIKTLGISRVLLERRDRTLKKKKRTDSRAICIRHFRKKNRDLLTDRYSLRKMDADWLVAIEKTFGGKIPVFIFWYQGFEEAPEIVKVCHRQLGRVLNKDKFQVITIDKDNLKDYVSFPQFIWQKFSNGIIDLTHLSDIVRTVLLYNYGGVWCDATYFLSADIPSVLLDNPLFVFRYSELDRDGEKASNAFIYARPQDEILGKVILQFHEYWKNKNKLCLYTLFHVFFALAVDSSEDCKREFAKIPLRDPALNEYCAKNLYSKYDAVEWEYIQQITFAHKLTYKLDKDKNHEGTLLHHIVQNY